MRLGQHRWWCLAPLRRTARLQQSGARRDRRRRSPPGHGRGYHRVLPRRLRRLGGGRQAQRPGAGPDAGHWQRQCPGSLLGADPGRPGGEGARRLAGPERAARDQRLRSFGHGPSSGRGGARAAHRSLLAAGGRRHGRGFAHRRAAGRRLAGRAEPSDVAAHAASVAERRRRSPARRRLGWQLPGRFADSVGDDAKRDVGVGAARDLPTSPWSCTRRGRSTR